MHQQGAVRRSRSPFSDIHALRRSVIYAHARLVSIAHISTYALANYAQGSKATRRKTGPLLPGPFLATAQASPRGKRTSCACPAFFGLWISCIANHTASPPTNFHDPSVTHGLFDEPFSSSGVPSTVWNTRLTFSPLTCATGTQGVRPDEEG